MNTARDLFAQIERAGADHFAVSSLAAGHGSVTRTVRRHRTARAAVTAVAGVGVVGAGSWGAIAAMGGADTLAPGALVSPSQDAATAAPSSAAASASAEPGGPVVDQVTLPEGRTVDQIASTLAEAYGVTPEEVSVAIEEVVAEMIPEATTAEGWLVPGTYSLTGAPTLREALIGMIGAREEQLTGLGVPRAEWQTVITTASLVEREAKLAEDKPKVARVIENRLAQGMKLELDSPVKFISDSEGVFTSDEERLADSPYNTYTNVGLPPGAIATPSLESLQAVVAPAEGDWLFFVTVNLTTGETRFANTFEEHMANVQVLQEWVQANQ